MWATAMLLTSGGRGGKEGNTWEDPTANSKGVGADAGKGLASPSSNGSIPSNGTVPVGSSSPRSMAGGAVGVATTCFACSVPRVSRRVACQGCGETFHWSCIGFYEHKYQRPGDNWRCKGCKGVEPSPPLPSPSAAGAVGLAAMMRAPQSGEAIDVGVVDVGLDPPPSTAPPATLPLAALVRAKTADATVVVTTAAMASPAAAVAAAAASTSAAASAPAAAAAAPQAPVVAAGVPAVATLPALTAVPAVSEVSAVAAVPAPAAPAPAVPASAVAISAPVSVAAARAALEMTAPSSVAALPAGERICPVCRKLIGRKRTMDCGVCRVPSHAGCVNVRGAETPIHWVCRDCRSGAGGNVEIDVGREVASLSSAAGVAAGKETARVSEALKCNNEVESSVPARIFDHINLRRRVGVGLGYYGNKLVELYYMFCAKGPAAPRPSTWHGLSVYDLVPELPESSLLRVSDRCTTCIGSQARPDFLQSLFAAASSLDVFDSARGFSRSLRPNPFSTTFSAS